MSAAVEPQQAPSQISMSYLEAIVQGQLEEMKRDERVIMLGEDIEVYGDGKLVERFDSARMPYSERNSLSSSMRRSRHFMRCPRSRERRLRLPRPGSFQRETSFARSGR